MNLVIFKKSNSLWYLNNNGFEILYLLFLNFQGNTKVDSGYFRKITFIFNLIIGWGMVIKRSELIFLYLPINIKMKSIKQIKSSIMTYFWCLTIICCSEIKHTYQDTIKSTWIFRSAMNNIIMFYRTVFKSFLLRLLFFIIRSFISHAWDKMKFNKT